MFQRNSVVGLDINKTPFGLRSCSQARLQGDTHRFTSSNAARAASQGIVLGTGKIESDISAQDEGKSSLLAGRGGGAAF